MFSKLNNKIERLSLRQMLLSAFVVLTLISCLAMLAAHMLLQRAQGILTKQESLMQAYDAAYALKLSTGQLLTDRNPYGAYLRWQILQQQTQAKLAHIQPNRLSLVKHPPWLGVWNNLNLELQAVNQQFAGKSLVELRKSRKPLLSMLELSFNLKSKNDFYVKAQALVDQIEYVQQFESFLVEDLEKLSHQYNQYSDAQVSNLRWLLLGVLSLYLACLTGLFYTLYQLTCRVENKLLTAQYALRTALDDIQSNQKQLIKNRDSMDYLAHHDELTGLVNRRYVTEYLEQIIGKSRLHTKKLALLFIDLDRFKEINDSLGHTVGDKVLVEIANRMRAIAKPDFVLARVGGDSFVYLINGDYDEEALANIAKAIIGAVSKTIRLQQWKLHVTCSVGISVYPDTAQTVEILWRNADAAMYSAKGLGKNNYQFYTEALTQQIQHRVALENRLHSLAKNNEFELFYQPQLDLKTRRYVGMEALIRCRDQNGNLIMPSEFIPIAEETGLIQTMSRWVLKTAAEQAVAWHKAGVFPGRIAINLSASLLMQPDFLENIPKLLAEIGCEPSWLELEITESQMMRFNQEVLAALAQLKSLGMSIAIDDFGTGYSSLAVLKTLPISKIKIDRSFLQNVHKDKQSGEIVRTMISMAQALNMQLIAEGVEEQAQADFLIKAGCTHGQGFLYAQPQPIHAIEALM